MTRPGAAAALALALLGASCVRLLPAPNPMGRVEAQPPPREARCILLLLPGVGDRGVELVRQGFFRQVQDRALPVAVAAADATLGYYFSQTLHARLAEDVIAPLRRAHPAARLWLAGISMGGFGALLFAQQHAAEVDGVLAMAPFLGGPELAQEIRAAGGLGQWKAPPREEPTAANYQRQLWRWLKEVTSVGAEGPKLHLGYGIDDPVSAQGAMLASALPSGRVTLRPGAHVWEAWSPIFDSFLDSPEFRSACGGPAAPSPASSP